MARRLLLAAISNGRGRRSLLGLPSGTKPALRASMHDDYLDQIRERLATGQLLDAAFDYLLPPEARSKSMLYWTPISVARMVATRLEAHGARYVLDAGSGPGKFCIVAGGMCPSVTFLGVEQRVGLVSVARELAARLRLINVHFELGDALARSWAPFDGFYFFNPFAQNALATDDVFDAAKGLAKRRFGSEAMRVAGRLREARRGSVVVTYHGLGGPIPSSYELTAEESSGSGCLRTWIKTRAREEEWVYLDHGAVSRIPLRALQRALRPDAIRNADPPCCDMPLERSRADLELGSGSDRAPSGGLQSGLDDLAG
jgi:predicted RNA methylase